MKRIFLTTLISTTYFFGFCQEVNYTFDNLQRLTQTQYTNGTIIQYCYDELGNRTCQNILAASGSQPDIAISNASASPTTLCQEATFPVSWLEENLGTANTGGFNTLVVFSSNATYESANDDILKTKFTSNLNSGASNSVTETVSLPPGIPVGAGYILVIADEGGSVSEISEINNEDNHAVTVTNGAGFSVGISTTAETCDDQNGSVTATPSGGSSPYEYVWSTNPLQTNATASGLQSGTYYLTVNDVQGCQEVTSADVPSGAEDPAPDFTYSIDELTVTFTNYTPNGTSYSWDFDDGNNSMATNPDHIYANGGNYEVTLSATNSCGTVSYSENVIVQGGYCPSPYGLIYFDLMETSVELAWQGSAEAVNYTVRYRENGTSTWTEMTTSNTYFIITGLVGATPYEVQVRTNCGGSNNSSFTSPQYFLTPGSGGAGNPGEIFSTVGNPSNDIYFTDLDIESNGDIIAGGSFSYNPYMVKFDSLGQLIWANRFDGAFGISPGQGITKTSDGGYAMTGYMKLNSAPENDLYVVKVNSAGVLQWMKIYGGSDDDRGSRIIEDGDGDLIIVGRTESYGAGDDDILILKLSGTGNFIWARTYGSSFFDIGLDLCEASNGDYLITGRARVIVPDPPGNTSVDCVVIVRLSQGGAFVWTKAYRDTDNQIDFTPQAIAEDVSGNIYVSGEYSDGAFVYKMNSSGTILWSKYLTTPLGNEEPTHLSFDNSGNLIVVGKAKVLTSDNSAVVFKISTSGNLLGSYNIYGENDEHNYGWGGKTVNDRVFITGMTESYDDDFKDNGFVVSRDLDFSSNCYGSTFTATISTAPTALEFISSTGSHTLTTTDVTPVVVVEPIDLISPCGSACPNAVIQSVSSVCQGTSVDLFSLSSNFDNLSWQIGFNGVPFSTEPNPSYSFSGTGTMEVYLIASNAYCSDTAIHQINSYSSPELILISEDINCAQSTGEVSSTVLSGTTPFTYLWNTGSTESSISGLSAGNYNLLVTDANACTANGSISLGNLLLISQADTTICPGDTVRLTVDDGQEYGLDFDGIDDYLSVPEPFTNFGTEITVEWWVNVTAFQVGSGISQSLENNNSISGSVWLMHGQTDGSLTWYVNDGGAWRATSTGVLSPGWHHLVGTANSAGTKIFVDGNLENSTSGIGSSINNSPNSVIHFGKDSRFATNRFMDGNIDEVRIWKRALDQSTISAWSNKTLNSGHPEYANLVGYWKLDEGSGSIATDFSFTNSTGNLFNGTAWVSNVPDIENSDLTWNNGAIGDSIFVTPLAATIYTVSYQNSCSDEIVVDAFGVNTFTGAGDGILWSDDANWSDGHSPFSCQDVFILGPFSVQVPAGYHAVGRTLEVNQGAILDVNPTAIMMIEEE